MILLGGIPSETSLAMVCAQIEDLGLPFVLFDQRRAAEAEIRMEIAAGEVAGCLAHGGRCHRLGDFTGVYLRLMDEQVLPELDGEPPDSPRRRPWSPTSPSRCSPSAHVTAG